MGPDYDAPRPSRDRDATEDPLLAIGGDEAKAGPDVDDDDDPDSLDLPDPDLRDEELTVRVTPKQRDEFTCPRCFLVHHITQLTHTSDGATICKECA